MEDQHAKEIADAISKLTSAVQWAGFIIFWGFVIQTCAMQH
jgi:hypothetical protein